MAISIVNLVWEISYSKFLNTLKKVIVPLKKRIIYIYSSLKRTIVVVILDKYFRCNNLICTSYIYTMESCLRGRIQLAVGVDIYVGVYIYEILLVVEQDNPLIIKTGFNFDLIVCIYTSNRRGCRV